MKRKEFLSNQPDPSFESNRNNEFTDNINNIREGRGIDEMLYESVKILKEKGYDEKGLNNGDQEGTFKEYLKTQLQHLLDSDDNLIGKHQFEVQNYGFFNKGDDIVRFTFTYEFDSEYRSISLKEVEAEYKAVPINQAVNVLSDIWASQDMHNRVKELWRIVHGFEASILDKNLNDVIQKESDRLCILGYERNDLLNIKLKTEILKSTDKDKSKNHFLIKMKSYCPQGEIKVNLYYEYKHAISQLTIKSIRAELNNRKVEYLNDGTSPIPSLDHLKAFYATHKNDLAIKLANHTPGNSLKNRLK